eukprot:EG_transcript_7233
MAFAAILLVVFLLGRASTWKAEDFPNPMVDVAKCGRRQAGLVCDPDAILSEAARNQSEAVVEAIAIQCQHDCQGQRVGYQVGLAVLQRMDANVTYTDSIAQGKAFATVLGARWGVSHGTCNDGIILLVSASDRVVYLRTAGGAQAALLDDVAAVIVARMRDAFKQGQYDSGAVGGLLLIRDALSGTVIQPPFPYAWLALLALLVFCLWPWLWCLAVCIYTLLAYPVVLVVDGVRRCAAWCRVQPEPQFSPPAAPADEDRERLRRIQREVEGMSKEKEYEQQMCSICLEEFGALGTAEPGVPASLPAAHSPPHPPPPASPPGTGSPLSLDPAAVAGKTAQEAAPLLEAPGSPPPATPGPSAGLADGAPPVTRLGCGHRFHRQCIQEWMGKGESPTCPMCREVIDVHAMQDEGGDFPEEDRLYKARLQYYMAHFHARSATYQQRPATVLRTDIDRLFLNRATDWYMWDDFWLVSLPSPPPAPSLVQALPSFSGAVSQSWDLQLAVARVSVGFLQVAGGLFTGGGGAGDSW